MSSSQNATPGAHSAQSRCSTILCVDDDPNVTAALARTLRAERFRCLSAESAAAALAILEREHVDVLISDERMPTTPGSELLAQVRQRFPGCIRIILSGQSSLESAVRAINEGNVYRFLLKPCHPSELVATIRQALQYRKLQVLSRELLHRHQIQERRLAEIDNDHPDLMALAVDNDGAIVVDEQDGDGSIEELIRQLEATIDP